MNNAIVFTIGAAVGSMVTWKLLKTKYAQIANEEIASVKELYSKKSCGDNNNDDAAKDINECECISVKNNYIPKEKEDKKYMSKSSTHLISPEELGEIGYETISLYYGNGILRDEENKTLSIKDTIGEEALKHFGEYEDDSVCVRNDDLQIDYEVLDAGDGDAM